MSMTASTCSGRYASPVAAHRSRMYSTVSAEPNTTASSGAPPDPFPATPRCWKNSIWKSRMRRTSFGVSVAATMSGRWRTTHWYASSGSNTASGGVSVMRAASRNTNTAAIARTSPTTMNPMTHATPTAYGRCDVASGRRGTTFGAMRVVVLGAGFAGLELTTRLSDELGDDADVVLIDQTEDFVFGFSRRGVRFGRTPPEAVRHPYRDLVKPGVTFVSASVDAIDAIAKRVDTSAGA